jgi:hypothetical protein
LIDTAQTHHTYDHYHGQRWIDFSWQPQPELSPQARLSRPRFPGGPTYRRHLFERAGRDTPYLIPLLFYPNKHQRLSRGLVPSTQYKVGENVPSILKTRDSCPRTRRYIQSVAGGLPILVGFSHYFIYYNVIIFLCKM